MNIRSEYWQRSMAQASLELQVADGALYYRLTGEGFEYLENEPEKKAQCVKVREHIASARAHLDAAQRLAHDLKLGFS